MKRFRGHYQQLAAAFLIGLIMALVSAQMASADEPGSTAPPPDPLVGYDISWPQCGGPYPGNYASIGVVGVNGGRPFTVNRCLKSEWDWTGQYSQRDAVYINLDYPRKPSVYQLFGPAGFCDRMDLTCQTYNYGWNAARDAVSRAGDAGVVTDEWWLDVETMNHWSENTGLNERIIAGAIEYLQGRGYDVGIYSTPYQWRLIAGGYRPGLAVWTAGAESYAEALLRCDNPEYAFGGGQVALVQYVETFDTNVICP